MGSCSWFPLSHAEIRAWVEQHHDSLPTTLAELAALPTPFRKIIVNYVPAEQRTRFWEEHLRSFLDPQSCLTAEQRTFILETIPLLGEIFARPMGEAQELLRPVEDRMRQLFTRPECFALFGTIGPLEPPEGLPLPPGTRLTPQ